MIQNLTSFPGQCYSDISVIIDSVMPLQPKTKLKHGSVN